MTFRRLHFPIMILAVLALLSALWAGLMRLGWPLPGWQPQLTLAHGPLMVAGFLGTLIALERAYALTVILKSRWLYLAPFLTGTGGLLIVIGVKGIAGPLLISIGSLGMSLLFALMLRRQPAMFTAVMFLGALTWLFSNLLWLAGWPIPRVVWGWAGFLILTIAGERLELSQLTRISARQRPVFVAIVSLQLLTLGVSLWRYSLGVRLYGIANILLALWLLRYDIARRTVRLPGQPRFTAICLLTGYIWLAAGGVLAIIYGGATAGLLYDAMLHTIFLGFAFSMIFGHAPIIFPALLGIRLPFHPLSYAPLILLHLTLLLRITGDLLAWIPGRYWAGLLNAFVLLLFFGSTAASALRANTKKLSATN